MAKRVPKAWNGGSLEEAMRLAKERDERLIATGQAVRCDECNGEGGTIHGVCIQCHGAGTLPAANDASSKSTEA